MYPEGSARHSSISEAPISGIHLREWRNRCGRDLPRRRLPSLIPKYMKGKLFQIKNIDDIAVYTRAKKVRVEPNNGEMRFVADGEEFKTRGIEVEMLEKAIRVLKIEEA